MYLYYYFDLSFYCFQFSTLSIINPKSQQCIYMYFVAYSTAVFCMNTQGGVVSVDSTPENSVVLYLVSKGANLNAPDNYGCTPLHFAAMRGNELVTYELLLCKGINIEVSNRKIVK